MSGDKTTVDCLSCNICFEEYSVNAPKMFPCGHLVCDKCVGKMTKKDGTIFCPYDRKRYRISDLTNDKIIHDIVNNPYALEWKKTRNLPLEDNYLLYCHKHPEEINHYYCSRCKSNVCKECVTSFHRGHALDSLHDSWDRKLSKLESEAENSSKWLERYENMFAELKTRKEENSKETKAKIKAFTTSLVDAIYEHQKELLGMVNDNFEKSENELKPSIRLLINNVERILEYVNAKISDMKVYRAKTEKGGPLEEREMKLIMLQLKNIETMKANTDLTPFLQQFQVVNSLKTEEIKKKVSSLLPSLKIYNEGML